MRDGKGKNKLKLKSLYLCHEWVDFLIQKQKNSYNKTTMKKTHPITPPPKYKKQKSLSVAKSRRQRSWAESHCFWASCLVAWRQGTCPASLLWCSQTGWRELGLFFGDTRCCIWSLVSWSAFGTLKLPWPGMGWILQWMGRAVFTSAQRVPRNTWMSWRELREAEITEELARLSLRGKIWSTTSCAGSSGARD